MVLSNAILIVFLWGVSCSMSQAKTAANPGTVEFRPYNPDGGPNLNPVALGIYYDKIVMNLPITLNKPLNLTAGTSLKVDGTLTVNGIATATSFVTPSDLRLKKDIKKISDSRQKLATLQGVYYKLRDGTDENRQHIGFIAQDVEKVFPELVIKNSKGIRGVSYSEFVVPLTEAMREQQAEIDQLQKENDRLKDRLEKIELLLEERKQHFVHISKDH